MTGLHVGELPAGTHTAKVVYASNPTVNTNHGDLGTQNLVVLVL